MKRNNIDKDEENVDNEEAPEEKEKLLEKMIQ